MLDAGNSLCSLLKMVSAAFPPESVNTPQDVKMLYQKVEELVQKHLAMVAAPQTSGEDNSASMISFVLYVIKSLAEVHKNLVDPFNLVRVLQRLARDMGLSSGTYNRQVCFIFFHLLHVRSTLLAYFETAFCLVSLRVKRNCWISFYVPGLACCIP